jgi:hypothetical protein
MRTFQHRNIAIANGVAPELVSDTMSFYISNRRSPRDDAKASVHPRSFRRSCAYGEPWPL